MYIQWTKDVYIYIYIFTYQQRDLYDTVMMQLVEDL